MVSAQKRPGGSVVLLLIVLSAKAVFQVALCLDLVHHEAGSRRLLPQRLSDIVSSLRDSKLVGVRPQGVGARPNGGDDHQQGSPRCPAAHGDWWPGATDNLRSMCPWVWEQLDIGEDASPRYIPQAKCLCARCVDNHRLVCEQLRQNVTILRVKAQQDGQAVMQQEVVTVTRGCTCAAPIPVRARKNKLHRLFASQLLE